MAVSGTVPIAKPPRFDAGAQAKRLRRATTWGSIAACTWFLLQFGAVWVPEGMTTVPSMPPGSWCIVDRWSVGVRSGSLVFVDGPDGRVLSQVARLDADTVTIEHPHPGSGLRDSRAFGPMPRAAIAATVMVVFPAGARVAPDGR